MIRRLFGPDPLKVRIRLLAIETLASAGIVAVFWTAGRMAEK